MDKDLKPEAIDWHTLEPDRVFAALHSSEAGLTADQATERLRIHGPNLIRKTKQDGILRLLWRQINNSLIWVLLASGTLAILLGKMTDGLVVLSVVLINAVIGFIQNSRPGGPSRPFPRWFRRMPSLSGREKLHHSRL